MTLALSRAVRTAAENANLQREVNAHDWVHQIDLGGGVVTPGRWPPHPLILRAFDTIDFRGKKVLDIGCWDGLWSFEAERRGAAEVYATDYITQRSYPEQPTFKLAHQALASKVMYFPTVSVFDIETLGEREFDVVIFCGVYYHLRDPLKALAKLRRVTREGGSLIVEGDAVFGTDESFARFFYDCWHYDDPSNWWVPSIPCLRNWIESSYFHVAEQYNLPTRVGILARLRQIAERCLRRDVTYISRVVMTAVAACRKDPNYVFPDEDFRDFDLNEYRVD